MDDDDLDLDEDDFALQSEFEEYFLRLGKRSPNSVEFEEISHAVLNSLRALTIARADNKYFEKASEKAKAEYNDILKRIVEREFLFLDDDKNIEKLDFVGDILNIVVKERKEEPVGLAAMEILGSIESRRMSISEDERIQKIPPLRAFPSDRIGRSSRPIAVNLKDLAPSRRALENLRASVKGAVPASQSGSENLFRIDLSESDYSVLIQAIETAIAVHNCQEMSEVHLDLLISTRNMIAKLGKIFGQMALAAGGAGTFLILLNTALVEMDKVINVILDRLS